MYLSVKVLLLACTCQTMHAHLTAQQPAQHPQPQAARNAEAVPVEVHVDQRCRVFMQERLDAAHPYSRPRFVSDTTICHISGEHHTEHWEQTLEQGDVKHTRVHIDERTYNLQNTLPQTIAFLVFQSLPAGWHVDSDPQPVDVTDYMATFRVIARPGETVRLHVGTRH